METWGGPLAGGALAALEWEDVPPQHKRALEDALAEMGEYEGELFHERAQQERLAQQPEQAASQGAQAREALPPTLQEAAQAGAQPDQAAGQPAGAVQVQQADQQQAQPVQRPSQALGLDASRGSLSAAAVAAVDGGASPVGVHLAEQVQAKAQAQQADAQAQQTGQASLRRASGGEVVLQNRDRSSAASVAQMQEIAQQPDYWRAGASRTMSEGAPVVFGDVPASAVLGRQEVVADGMGERVGTRYAVVEADDVISSHRADGLADPAYARGEAGRLRAVAGNGRAAGLRAAFERGTAAGYRQELLADAQALGLDAQQVQQVQAMRAPMLVRVMDAADVRADMADRSNVTGTQRLSPVEEAANDARRLDLTALQFDEQGRLSAASVRGFVQAMPVAERGNLLNPDGSPTRQAQERIMAAAFKQAYGHDELVRLVTQAADPDARAVLSALAEAAPQMAALTDAGEFDIRQAVADAAVMAVNAARQSHSLADWLRNADLAMPPEAFVVARFLAQNMRSARRMADGLKRFAQLALEQLRIAEENLTQGGMFGQRPTLSRAQLLESLSHDDFTHNAAGPDAREPGAGQALAAQPGGLEPAGQGAERAGAGQAGEASGAADGRAGGEAAQRQALGAQAEEAKTLWKARGARLASGAPAVAPTSETPARSASTDAGTVAQSADQGKTPPDLVQVRASNGRKYWVGREDLAGDAPALATYTADGRRQVVRVMRARLQGAVQQAGQKAGASGSKAQAAPAHKDKPRFSLGGNEAAGDGRARADEQFRETERAYGGKAAYEQAKSEGKTKLNYRQWVQVRTPAFKAWFGDWEAAQSARILQGAPVAELSGQEAPHGYPALRAWALAQFEKVGGKAVHPLIGEVTLDMRAVRDSMAHGMNPFKAQAFAAVAPVIEKGAVVMRAQEGQSIYISAPVKIQGVDDVVTVLVHRDEHTQRMYVHSVTTKENLLKARDSSSSTAASAISSGKVTSGDVASVLHKLLKFNAAAVSKVTDPETGEPLVVYHGSAQGDFNIFDRRAWKTSYGHFFSPNEATAKVYRDSKASHQSRTFAVFLQARQPLDVWGILQDGYGWPDWAHDFAAQAQQDWAGEEQLDEEPLEWLSEAIAQGSLYGTTGGLQAEFLAAAEQAGHDAVIMPDAGFDGRMDLSFVVFEPAQIKSATENTGAFDAGEEDIRFRLGDEAGGGDLDDQFAQMLKRAQSRVHALERAGRSRSNAELRARQRFTRLTGQQESAAMRAWAEQRAQWQSTTAGGDYAQWLRDNPPPPLEPTEQQRHEAAQAADRLQDAVNDLTYMSEYMSAYLYGQEDESSQAELSQARETLAMLQAVQQGMRQMQNAEQDERDERRRAIKQQMQRAGGPLFDKPDAAGRQWWEDQLAQQTQTDWGKVADVWLRFAQSQNAFRYPSSGSASIEDVASEMSHGRIKASWNGDKTIILSDDGGRVFIYNADGKTPYVYAMGAGGKKKKSSGTLFYAIAHQWAFNNGKTIVPDSGLTSINSYRRTSNMISAALRAGSTRHMKPHGDQGIKGWKEGADRANLAAMLRREMDTVFAAAPQLQDVRYDVATGRFRHARTGAAIGEKRLASMAESALGDQPWSNAYGVGENTAKRAIVSHTLLEMAANGQDMAAVRAPADTLLYSRSPDTRQAYEARIDELFAGGKANRVGARVLDRSDVLGLLGHAEKPVVLAEGKVLAGQQNHPRMTAAVWKKVPEWLENPAAVFESDTEKGRLVVIAPELVNGAPVSIIVEPNPTAGGEQLYASLLVNAYDRSGKTPFMRWIGDGLMRYADKTKFPAVFALSVGRRLPDTALQNKPGTARILTEKHLAAWRRVHSPAFRQGQPVRSGGFTPELARKTAALQTAINAIHARWPNAPEATVVADMDDARIPQAVRNAYAGKRSQGARGRVRGFHYQGRVWLVAAHVKDGAEAAQVMAHETLGHHGLQGLFGTALQSVLDRIGLIRRAAVVAKAREYGLHSAPAQVAQRLSDAQIWHSMTPRQRREAAEEVLARMAEQQPTLGLVREALAAIRAWLRQHVPGFAQMKVSDEELIREYVLPARGWVTRGQQMKRQGADYVHFQLAWHGSPHSGIEKTGFKLNKIGSGEGAQAYGWGIYFASRREVAEGYRKALSLRERARQFMRELPEDADADEVLQALEDGELSPALAQIVRALAADDWLGFDYPAQALDAAFRELDAYDPSAALREAIRQHSGQLYSADIPEDKDLLDWDKPLVKQPAKVKRRIGKWLQGISDEMFPMMGLRNKLELVREMQGMNGATFYDMLHSMLGDAPGASRALLDAGIPGLRYLDGQSRRDGEGTHNYVIWDEALLTPEAAQIEPQFSIADEVDEQFEQTAQEAGGKAAYEQAKSEGKTKLNYRQWVQVRTPAFKAWFGNWEGDPENASKVVDAETGEPLVVYHGTDAEFSVFEQDKLGGNTFANANHTSAALTAALGHWFSTADLSQSHPNSFGRSKAVFLNIRDAQEFGSLQELMQDMDGHVPVDEDGRRLSDVADFDDLQDLADVGSQVQQGLRDDGYDGIVVWHDDEFGHTSYVAFDANQIKSATENTGAFDAGNDDIRFSLSPMKDADANIRRGREALAKAITGKTSVHRAMFRNGLGWVDFVWGDEGRVTPSGKSRGAMGLAHIMEARQRKDGMSQQQIDRLLDKMVQTIARGRELSAPQTIGAVTRLGLAFEKAVVWLSKRVGANAWVVTAYEERPGGASAGRATNAPTHVTASRTRDDMGAGSPSIGQNAADGKPRFDLAGGNKDAQAKWAAPDSSWLDDVLYQLQDKHVDTLRVQQAIERAGQRIDDAQNVRQAEELYHGRVARRLQEFMREEVQPLLALMQRHRLSMQDVQDYLHARHAKEANALIAQRDPSMPDGGSGMTNAEADALLADLNANVPRRLALQRVAEQVDAMIEGTREALVDYGLESEKTVQLWREQFAHYVPLMREQPGDEGRPTLGTGQGFSVKGREVKGRTGSTRQVVDVFANIVMQRERALVRGEKNRVALALLGLVRSNPNPDVWRAGPPPAKRTLGKDGKVRRQVDPNYKSRDVVLVAKVKQPNGSVKEVAVTMNEHNERARRMARALKNLDAQEMSGAMGVMAKATRYFAAVNTQYNPVFGLVNLMRDAPAALINLSSTPLKGEQWAVTKNALPALKGIYKALRAERAGGQPKDEWGRLLVQFQQDGGSTGYRDQFATSADRARALQRLLTPQGWMDSGWGRMLTLGGALRLPAKGAQVGFGVLLDWLTDYNDAMENALRLAAYKAALDKGMSRAQAASIAKNLTVNFNRKGAVAQQAGALYAFFNAAMQGTARIAQTLAADGRLTKAGKRVVLGGLALGVLQALALAAAGLDDDDVPPFVQEKSLIIPTGGKSFVTIPMPLGYHVIPGLGRHAAQFAMGGFKDWQQRGMDVLGMLAEALNPIGNAGWSAQTFTPTVLDPWVALGENRDWAGREIARKSRNPAEPGFKQARDTATPFARWLAEVINAASGGNAWRAGVSSPTPDQIDYLIGVATGGVGREAAKLWQGANALMDGEELPAHKRFLLGRFYGDADSASGQQQRFYATVRRLEALETEIKGMRADGEVARAAQLAKDNPQVRLIAASNAAQLQMKKLREHKRRLLAQGAGRDQVRAVEEQMARLARGFNERVARERP